MKTRIKIAEWHERGFNLAQAIETVEEWGGRLTQHVAQWKPMWFLDFGSDSKLVDQDALIEIAWEMSADNCSCEYCRGIDLEVS
jgi:hypothetical protein